MMPQSMIISNGVGGFIQYPQMQTPFFPQMAQVGGMQMILQPTLQLRHVSINLRGWCFTRKIVSCLCFFDWYKKAQ